MAGVESPNSLYDPALASFVMGDEYQPTDAIGFIKLFGMPMKAAAVRDARTKKA